MKATVSQLISKPLFRPLSLVFVFIVITTTLNMFWKTASTKSGKVGFEGDDGAEKREDKLVTAHFMVSSTSCHPLCFNHVDLNLYYSPAGEYLPVSGVRLAGEFQVGRGDRHVSLSAARRDISANRMS